MSSRLDRGVKAELLLESARELGLRVAVAESLTGGLLADAFVVVPGASHAFTGAIVAYDTQLKHTLLGVDAAILRDRGPVDAEVAQQMASGVRLACALPGANAEALPVDIGLATTGVAGPDADPQTGQPPGTVWIGVSSKLGERATKLDISGNRAEIRARAVEAALSEFAQEIQNLSQVDSHSANAQEYSD